MISFRCEEEEMQTAQSYCERIGMDITTYLVLSVLNYVEAKAQQGEIDCPDFLRNNPFKNYDYPTTRTA